ncbi:DUF4259 domain-containing protein [Micromonospora sp. DPT]|uniref:DUF4259 domain-containing protein n=1 Tax=Micromonospora sp. DPT TaxID=3142975 RepID=UPI003209C0F8
MGTWGRGPFDNDQALDLVDELSDMGDAEKADYLREIFTDALNPTPNKEIWPKEVTAAAALIAMMLPGGAVAADPEQEGDYELDAEDDWFTALLLHPGPDLRALAYDALRAITSPQSQWFKSRSDDREIDATMAWLDNIGRVLQSRECRPS